MKIVVAGTRGFPNILGGIETHCQELYPRLAAAGCDVIVLRRSSYVTLENKIDHYRGVSLKDIYAPRSKSLEAIVHTFLSVFYAWKIKADIIHIHAVGPALLIPFARLLGLHVVFTHHGPDYDREKWGYFAKWMLKIGERMGVRFAHRVIVISEVIAQLLEDTYGFKNSILIYNGVNTPKRIETTDYITSLHISSTSYIVALGRFVPEKAFEKLIEAYASLRVPSIKLVIAGDADHDTSYSQKLKQLAQKEEIVLTGFINGDKLYELLTHAALFVLPSTHEGLPIALLEAMSYSLPVIVSDIPANKAVGLDEECYFKTGDVEQLAQRISDFFDNPDRPHRVSYDLRAYDWDHIATQVEQVYHSIYRSK